MRLTDFSRFKKYMALTTSANDAEALAALRQANALIEREGLTWTRVLDRSVKVIQEVEAAPENYSHEDVYHHAHSYAAPHRQPSADKEIDDAIAIIESRSDLRGDFEDTITSVISQYRQGKRLSSKQTDLLFRVARR